MKMNCDNEKDKKLLVLLQNIEDFRSKRGVKYRLCDLLLLSIYSILAGYVNASEMEYYINLNFDYFKEEFGITSVPSHDTFSRVLRFTNFDKLSEILEEWLEEYYPELCQRYGKHKVLHIDGKAARGASEKSNGENPKYLLNAMYEGGTIKVTSKKVGEKENEISCLPEFLRTFNLKDTIVTMDSIGCNRTVVDVIVNELKGDYVFVLKENQKKLYNAIKKECKRLKKENKFNELDDYQITEKGHGRIETYRVALLEDLRFILNISEDNMFYGTIGKVGIMDKKTLSKKNGEWVKKSTRTYLISSLETITAEDMLQIRRSHWNVEMEHWKLDVILKEDLSTQRKNNSISNLSALKRFAMRIKKQRKEYDKVSLNLFGMAMANNPKTIEKVLFERKDN